MKKETKNIHGLLLFFGIHEFFFCLDTKETKNQASIFLSQKSSDAFPYRDPSRSCSALDSGVTPFCQRWNPCRDFLVQKYKGDSKIGCCYCYFLFEDHFFFFIDYYRVNNLLEFVNLWFQRRQKIFMGYYCFLVFMNFSFVLIQKKQKIKTQSF